MSGGVDSAVAAFLLREKGHEVIGVTMKLFTDDKPGGPGRNLNSVESAASIADFLGIPHVVADLRRSFEARIINDFCREYSRGRTPNPCVRCNREIKFDLLWRRAKALGGDSLATGHYARTEYDPSSQTYLLRKGRSTRKDQSYFLYRLGQEELARTVFPLGEMTKSEVRDKARRAGLSVADRSESQEVCFIPDDDYVCFLFSRFPEAFMPGPIVDLRGRILGRHKGIGNYTVGQRRGLGISAAHPLYVVAIDAPSRTVTVGRNEDLLRRSLKASNVSWVSGNPPERPVSMKARIRYKHREAAALVIPEGANRATVEFKETQRAVTPGQSVVFFRGDDVLGGGTIDSPDDG